MDKQKIVREVVKGAGVLALLILLMMWLSGSFRSKTPPGPPVAHAQQLPAKTKAVEQMAFPLFMEQVGAVRSQTEAQVAGRIMAQVNAILVKEGDMVQGPGKDGKNAAVMARLDDRDIQARIRQAQSQVAASERAVEAARANMRAARARVEAARAASLSSSADYARYETLNRSKAATGQQLDHARSQKDVAEAQLQAAIQLVTAADEDILRLEAQKQQAEAALAEAQVALSHAIVRAPFSGRVIRKMLDVGDTAAPGQPIFIMEGPQKPEFHATVSESLISDVHAGQTIDVGIDALGEHFTGTVREITPQSDPTTRTVMVKVSLPPDPRLITGLFGRMNIPAGEYKALVAPLEAVREVGQLELVDALDPNGRPQRRFVTLGRRHDGVVEVLSGLREGEEVVLQ